MSRVEVHRADLLRSRHLRHPRGRPGPVRRRSFLHQHRRHRYHRRFRREHAMAALRGTQGRKADELSAGLRRRRRNQTLAWLFVSTFVGLLAFALVGWTWLDPIAGFVTACFASTPSASTRAGAIWASSNTARASTFFGGLASTGTPDNKPVLRADGDSSSRVGRRTVKRLPAWTLTVEMVDRAASRKGHLSVAGDEASDWHRPAAVPALCRVDG